MVLSGVFYLNAYPQPSSTVLICTTVCPFHFFVAKLIPTSVTAPLITPNFLRPYKGMARHPNALDYGYYKRVNK